MNTKKIICSILLFGFAHLSISAESQFNPPDTTKFAIAVELKDKKEVQKWLEQGLNPNYEGSRIGTGLMIAAWNGDIELMELFLKYGADINYVSSRGEQAILQAAFKGQKKAVEWLLDHGATVNRDNDLQWTALHYASFGGHEEVFDYLVSKGANINARTTNGSTALMMAVYEGQDKIVDKLISLNANKTIKNDWGDGALDWAVKYEKFNIAKKVAPSENELAETINRPKYSWGKVFKSEKSPAELEKMMYDEMVAKYNGQDTKEISSRIAQYQKKLMNEAFEKAKKKQAKDDLELVVKAKKNTPNEQSVEIIKR